MLVENRDVIIPLTFDPPLRGPVGIVPYRLV